MAYKFQIGAANLSGSVQLTDGSLDSTNVDDTTAANIVTQIDDGEIAHTKVALENGDILIGDANGFAQNQTISGDATLAAGGALTIADDAIDNDKLANIARGSIKVGGAANAPTDLDAKTSGQILVGDGTDLVSVAVSGDLALAADGAMTIQANAVEGSMINSNAAGNGLGYSSNALNVDAAQTVITSIYNTSLKLGRAADDDNIDFGTDDSIIFNIDNGEKFRIASGSVTAAVDMTAEGNLVVEGNLTVQGTTTTVDSANILVTGSISFEGSTGDDFETTLGVVDPTADRDINLPNIDGNLAAFSDSSFQTAASAITLTELNLLDGGSTVDTATVADGDAVLFNDAGTMKQLNVTSLKTYFQTGVTADEAASLRLNGADTVVNSDITISNDVILVDSSAARSLTMPNIADADVGQLYMIKDVTGQAATNNITINESAANHDIDGSVSVVLESDNGAIMLLACSSSNGFFYSIF